MSAAAAAAAPWAAPAEVERWASELQSIPVAVSAFFLGFWSLGFFTKARQFRVAKRLDQIRIQQGLGCLLNSIVGVCAGLSTLLAGGVPSGLAALSGPLAAHASAPGSFCYDSFALRVADLHAGFLLCDLALYARHARVGLRSPLALRSLHHVALFALYAATRLCPTRLAMTLLPWAQLGTAADGLLGLHQLLEAGGARAGVRARALRATLLAAFLRALGAALAAAYALQGAREPGPWTDPDAPRPLALGARMATLSTASVATLLGLVAVAWLKALLDASSAFLQAQARAARAGAAQGAKPAADKETEPKAVRTKAAAAKAAAKKGKGAKKRA